MTSILNPLLCFVKNRPFEESGVLANSHVLNSNLVVAKENIRACFNRMFCFSLYAGIGADIARRHVTTPPLQLLAQASVIGILTFGFTTFHIYFSTLLPTDPKENIVSAGRLAKKTSLVATALTFLGFASCYGSVLLKRHSFTPYIFISTVAALAAALASSTLMKVIGDQFIEAQRKAKVLNVEEL